MQPFNTFFATLLVVSLAQSAKLPDCVVSTRTSLCTNSTVDYSFVLRVRYYSVDCTTAEAIDYVSKEGGLAFAELEGVCKTMPLSDQDRKVPPLQYTQEADTVTCLSGPDLPVILTDWFEAEQFTEKLQLSDCHASSTVLVRNVRGCVEDKNSSVCNDGKLDYAVLDADARPDCPAFEVRGDVVSLGLEGLRLWEDWCSAISNRRLQYSEDCPGSTVNLRTFNTLLSKTSNEFSYHWHYHSVRGLEYNPLLITAPMYGCQNSICTTSNTGSCWPRPRFQPSSTFYNAQTRVHACQGSTAETHIVGRVSGTYEMQGTTYSTDPSNECSVMQPATNRVRITCASLSWSGVWVNQLGPWTATAEKQSCRNVCSQ